MSVSRIGPSDLCAPGLQGHNLWLLCLQPPGAHALTHVPAASLGMCYVSLASWATQSCPCAQAPPEVLAYQTSLVFCSPAPCVRPLQTPGY